MTTFRSCAPLAQLVTSPQREMLRETISELERARALLRTELE